MKKFDLEDRLIALTTEIIKLAKVSKKDFTGIHLSKQLIRSGTSVSLNYGEAQSSESRSDFIHKIKIILKELRESRICIKLLIKSDLISFSQAKHIQKEIEEVTKIFVKSVQTALRNKSINKK